MIKLKIMLGLKELKKKYTYVQVSNKYDILKVSELLSKIGVVIFENDKSKIKILDLDDSEYLKNSFQNSFFIINGNDGWRIQTHFIGTGNTVNDLEDDINFYLNRDKRINLGVDEVNSCDIIINELNLEFESLMCYVQNNYTGLDDIKDVEQKFKSFTHSLSKRYYNNFDTFKNDIDFESNLEIFIRNFKINKLIE